MISDKLQKKLRPFLDEKLKVKARLLALTSALESASADEVTRVYQEHDATIIEVISFGLEYRRSKAVTALEKLPVGQRTLNAGGVVGKELSDYLNVLAMLKPVIQSSPDFGGLNPMRMMTLFTMLKPLLPAGNHHKLRVEAFRLMLLLVAGSCAETLVSAIHDVSATMLTDDRIASDSENLIFEAADPITAEDASIFLKDTFALVTLLASDADHHTFAGASKSRERIDFLMTNVALVMFTKYNISVADVSGNILHIDSILYAESCPTELLKVTVTFFESHVMHSALSKAVKILYEVVFQTPAYLTLFKNLFDQILSIKDDRINLAMDVMQILRVWTLIPEREPLLQNFCFFIDPFESSTMPVISYTLRNIVNFFKSHGSSSDNTSDSSTLLADSLMIIRGLSMELKFQVSETAWNCIFQSLLDIHQIVLSAEYKHRFNDAILSGVLETILLVWIRSMTREEKWWVALHDAWTKPYSLNNVSSTIQWTKTMNIIVGVLAKHVCKVDLEEIKSHTPPRGRNISLPNQLLEEHRTVRRDSKKPFEKSHADLNSKTATLTGSRGDLTKHVAVAAPFDDKEPASPKRPTTAPADRSLMQPTFAQTLHQLFYEHSTLAITSSRDVFQTDIAAVNVSITNFVKISELQWNQYSAMFMWQNMLRITGNVLLLPLESHLVAMSFISEMSECMMKVRQSQPWISSAYPPMYDIIPWLIGATNLKDPQYNSGKCIAYATLCKLVCRKHFDANDEPSLKENVYAFFYAALIKCLSAFEDVRNIEAVIGNCRSLFTLNLPGVDILIPAFLVGIEKMFAVPSEDGEVSSASKVFVFSNTTKESAIEIVASLALLVSHNAANDTTLPYSRKYSPSSLINEAGTGISYSVLLKRIRALLYGAILNAEDVDGEMFDYQCMALNLLTCISLNDLYVSSSEVSKIKDVEEVITCILDRCHSASVKAILCATDCLSIFLQHPQLLSKFNDTAIRAIAEKIIGAVTGNLLQDRSDVRDCIITKLLWSLREWIMVVPPSQMETKFCQQFFELIESAMVTYNTPINAVTVEVDESVTIVTDGNSATKNIVRDAAIDVLNHWTHFYNNGHESRDYSSSMAVEESSESTIYESVNDRTVIAVSESEMDDVDLDLTIRNSAGKFKWNVTNLNHEEKSVRVPLDLHSKQHGEPETHGEKFEAEDLNADDVLHNLLSHLSEQYPIFADKLGSLNQPPKFTEEQQTIDDQYRPAFEKHFVKLEGIRISEKERQINEEIEDPLLEYNKPTASELARLFLHNFGLLDQNSFHNHSLSKHPLEILSSKSLFRDIKGIDKTSPRENIKIAVVYVAPGQETETELFENEWPNSSAHYQAFVTSLGQDVKVDTTPGFLGGLERTGATGDIATYYSNSFLEIMFHDCTKFPLDTMDAKQVKKKRHIGNDHVHIIWNEHHRQYSPATIGGDFGNVQIVISALNRKSTKAFAQQMYSVEIRRDCAYMFGPAVDNIVVPGYMLGIVVRTSAVNGHRYTVAGDLVSKPSCHLYSSPFQARATDIANISARHGSHKFDFANDSEEGKENLAIPEQAAGYDKFLRALYKDTQTF